MPAGPGGNNAQGIYLFGEDDAQGLFSDLLNLGQASTSTQLVVDRGRLTTLETDMGKRAIRTYKWANDAARIAQAGMSEGDLGDQADTDNRFRWSGTAWQLISGSSIIVPTTVASVGTAPVDALGRVNFSGITTGGTLRINADKTALARFSRVHLLLDCEAGTAGQTVYFTLRLADGATINSAAASYVSNGSLTSAGAHSALAPAAGTSWALPAARRYQKGFRYEFSDLAIAHETSATWKGDGYDIGQTNLVVVNGGMLGHTAAALAADGWEFTFTLTGGASASGTIRVVGEM